MGMREGKKHESEEEDRRESPVKAIVLLQPDRKEKSTRLVLQLLVCSHSLLQPGLPKSCQTERQSDRDRQTDRETVIIRELMLYVTEVLWLQVHLPDLKPLLLSTTKC